MANKIHLLIIYQELNFHYLHKKIIIFDNLDSTNSTNINPK